MARRIQVKNFIPYISAILIFMFISLAYFPQVLEGERLGGHDNAQFRGMSREIADHNKENEEKALWSNNMFGGMPAFMTLMPNNGNKLKVLASMTQVGPRPISFIFLYTLGFFILLVSFRVNPWLAIVGALAFAFSSYNFVILAAGHNSKAIAIGYMAPVIAGLVVAFRGYRLGGALLLALALSLQIRANHLQITYYTMMIVLVFGAFQLYYAFSNKLLTGFLKTTGLLLIAALFAVASNTDKLWTTLEYGKYTMRSESELVDESGDKTKGLTKSYATAWSYGPEETFSLLIPGFRGGASDVALSEKSATYELFARSNPAQAREVIKHIPLYWGPQSSTMGNVYLGAIVLFLFVLGMFLVDKKIKWWLLTVSLLGILLSWGRHFMPLTEFFMENIPGYNKFRSVSMTLVIPAFAMPLLGILAVQKIINGGLGKDRIMNSIYWSAGITAGLSLVFFLLPDLAGNFSAARDASYQAQLVEAMQEDRRALIRSDALRSFLLIMASAGLLVLYLRNNVKLNILIIGLGALILVDMWPINKRYLNEEDFSKKRETIQPFQASAADQFIMQQPGENQRVIDLTKAVWQDASVSYFHQSLGGYHGAKLRRYQDMIEHELSADIERMYGAFRSQNMRVIDSTLSECNSLNMVNTQYIIINPEARPIMNRHAMGNAWFVNKLSPVDNANEEMAALPLLDLDREAVTDKKFVDAVSTLSFPTDSTAAIELSEYGLNRMVYQSSSQQAQLAVFSEIYYEKGWNAYIDGEKAEHLRVNYLLRGLEVPAGTHEIVFEFQPTSFYTGIKISGITSILLLLAGLGALASMILRKAEKKKEEFLPAC